MFNRLTILTTLFISTINAQVFVNSGFALYSKLVGNNVEITMTAPQEYGYVAFGFGSSMSKAEVYVGWINAQGQPQVSRRASTARSEPKVVDEQDLQIVRNTSGVLQGQQVITFRRPLRSAPADGTEVALNANADSTPLIWALHRSAKPSGGSIRQHTVFGTESSAKLFARNSAFSVSKLGSTAGAGGADELTPKQQYIRAHAILMAIAWVILAPLGIAVARFFKGALGKWWFRIHASLFTVGVGGFTIIGFALAIIALNTSETPHFSFGAYQSSVGGIHVVYGLLIVILMIAQILLGFVIDKLFDPSRSKTPFLDKLHWYLGRGVYLSGVINVFIGVALFNALNDLSDNLYYYILIGWSIIVAVLFVVAQRTFGQQHDHEAKKPGYI